MPSNNHVIIIGGGVIGCSVAYHLAGAGLRVTVVERGRVGGGASGVAAGMVAPLSETPSPGHHLKLALESCALHLELLPRLQEESGIDVEYLPSGILHLAFTPEDEDRLRARMEWQEPLGMGVQWLSSQEARLVEPALGEEVTGALLSPREGHLNSGRLVRALAQGAARRGAAILQDTEVLGLLSHQGRVTGVKLPSGDLEGEWVVLASGAWAGLYGGWLGVDVPVHPVRGQILATRALPCPISRIVWHGLTYLLPKADGSVVLGTTSEEAGFRDRATLQGIAGILRRAIRLVPAVAEGELHRVWAGLRPASPDGLPILGPVPGWEGILLAVGHFRSGILLSAITGKMICDYIVRGDTQPLAPSSLSRFAS
ncbi:MAG: Glycine oxidase ThiO [Dehalococcoidia bacterium]|nr:Glycine oxidase ThiO [Dehalococcoidia bacterium]